MIAERKFFDNEALLDILEVAKSKIGLDFKINNLVENIKREDADILNDAILQVLENSDFASDVDFLRTNPPSGQQHGFGLRIRRKIRDGKIEQVTFYRVKESSKTGILALAGLAAAIWMRSPTIIISGTSLLYNVWRNLVTLKDNKNKNEIAAYEALLRLQVKKIQESDIKYYWPSTKEIHIETGNVNDKDTILGLTRLFELKLIEVKHWGNRPYDVTSMKNLWCQIF